jgi:hypothetical protein
VAIDFNSSQLNDALKTLTVLDLGNGRVTGVSYNSEAPLAQRLGGLHLPIGEHTTRSQLLDALRGDRIEVRDGTHVAYGRLLGVEQRVQPARDGASTMIEEITLIGDGGDIHTVAMTPAVTVKLSERESAQQVGAYMNLLASGRSQDRRRMSIATAGTGARDLLVSYISEVPIWKTTYRIVLPAGSGPSILQAWAVVDNTIGEDWQNVELSLVAGAPQSFVQQLSQPLYVQRPVVAVPQSFLVAPQTHQATLTKIEQNARQGGAPIAESVTVTGTSPRIDTGTGGGSFGGIYRSASGAIVGGLAASPPPPPPPAATPRAAMADSVAQLEPAAQGRELGDLFEYRVKEPITIAKNQSALVPILRSEVVVDRVSLWNGRARDGRPLRSLWLTNSSGLTLDAGSFTVLDADAFAGEGLIEPLKPGEKRLLSYAVDLGVQIEPRNGDEQRTVTHTSIARGVLVQHSESVSSRVYTIRNSDSTERHVVIEHPIRNGWKLAESVKAAETSADAYRFVVTVAPAKTETLTVTERRPIESAYRIADITDQQVEFFLRESGNDRSLRSVLAPVLSAKAALAAINADLAARGAEMSRINDDQQRVRENLKALKGSSEEQRLVKRYAAQLAGQEDRVTALKKESDDLERRRHEAQAELARQIDALSADIGVGSAALR